LSLADEIVINPDMINKAKTNDGPALLHIGFAYWSMKKDHSKAMAWYQLAVNQNFPDAYNIIGLTYARGSGVSRDYITAMEFFLKAARDNSIVAMSNIGANILKGKGAPVDKYKTLEWFSKCGNRPVKVEVLNQQGIHLTEEDKSKSFYDFESCYWLTFIK
jgi:TPR repeat protein